MMNKVAVVILNWNGKAFLEQFLPYLVKHTTLPEVALVVADNGSTDDSQEFVHVHYPQIQWIGWDKNYGYAGGYNKALEQIEARYYVLLNSDVAVTENWLPPLIRLMDLSAETGVCMPKIRSYSHPDYFEYAGAAGGFIDKYGFPFCRGRILNHVEEDCGQYDTIRDIFWASGACMAVRSSLFKKLGGFDDDFFAHMEEIDFCWRAKQLGYSIVCHPQSEVYHVGGGTLPQETPFKLFLNYRNSLYMLYKNVPDKSRTVILATRFFIDGISSIIYCFQGKFSSFAALWKAYIHFWKHRKNIRKKRLLQHNYKVSEIYPASIVFGFYLSKTKRIFPAIESRLKNYT